MKSFIYPAIIAVALTGCSTDSTSSNAASNASNKITTADAPVNAAVNQVNSTNTPNAVSRTNTNAVNAINAPAPVIQDAGLSRKNLELLKSKGKDGDKNAAPIPAIKAVGNPAPDNSELSSSMNEKGVPIETRIFKNNATLAKIEKSFEDINNPIVKIYLKNGKVLTAPKNAVSNAETATADEILRAVGVKP